MHVSRRKGDHWYIYHSERIKNGTKIEKDKHGNDKEVSKWKIITHGYYLGKGVVAAEKEFYRIYDNNLEIFTMKNDIVSQLNRPAGRGFIPSTGQYISQLDEILNRFKEAYKAIDTLQNLADKIDRNEVKLTGEGKQRRDRASKYIYQDMIDEQVSRLAEESKPPIRLFDRDYPKKKYESPQFILIKGGKSDN